MTPVVFYLRCSSSGQELSIDQQREVCQELCDKKGYTCVREYVDEGKSASKDLSKRVAFHRMIADSDAKDFKWVVCWDAARFTRYHNIIKSSAKAHLLDNGIGLDTVKEGIFDWSTSEGRDKDHKYVEANLQAAVNISIDSLRGRKKICALGWWPVGVVPFGYDKLYTDGEHSMNEARRSRFKKGRNWHLKLTINEAEAAVVREVFQRIHNTDISYRALAAELQKRGITPPDNQGGKSQGCWDKSMISAMLRQKAYIGVARFGGGRTSRQAHNRAEKPIEQAGACPVIVDRDLFDAVQVAVEEKRASGRKPHYLASGYLSGFLICGHCGYRLTKKNYKPTGRVYYSCSSSTDRKHHGCAQWRVYEDTLLEEICPWLTERVDFELLRRMQEMPKDNRETDAALLRQKIKGLEKKIDDGTESALLAPPAAREAAWKKINAWQLETEQARETLSLLEVVPEDPALRDFGEWWKTAKAGLTIGKKSGAVSAVRPGYAPVDADTAEYVTTSRDQFRGFLARLGFSVKLWWRHDPEARKHNRCAVAYSVETTEITVKTVLSAANKEKDVAGLSNSCIHAHSHDRD